MIAEHQPPLVDLAGLHWPARRIAAALAIAVPNEQRIARAALQRLTLDDHAAAFAAWCDTQASHCASKLP